MSLCVFGLANPATKESDHIRKLSESTILKIPAKVNPSVSDQMQLFSSHLECVCWSLKLSTCVVDSKRRGKIFLDIEDGGTQKTFAFALFFGFFLFLSFPLLLSLKYTTPVLGWKRQRRAMCEKHQMEQAIKWLSNSTQAPSRRSDRSKQTAD